MAQLLKLIVRQKWRIILIVSAAYLFYTELLCHHVQARKWSTVHCKGDPNSNDKCTRVLFVADPQLIGETNDEHFYNGLAIYDSDNYLKRTFRCALAHAQPDVIVFLGDIFDEGSVATAEQYERYLQRFRSIFPIDQKTLTIIVPGDNDIGGENGEIVTAPKVNRFKAAFKPRRQYRFRGNVFYHANRVTNEAILPIEASAADIAPGATNVVVLSHFSILFNNDWYSDRVLRTLTPNVIFSGHFHRSMFIKRSQLYTEFTKANPLSTGATDRYSVHEFDLNPELNDQSFLEILVPTSSYRMGERNIGYGMAVLEGDHLMYSVLWSVDRFQQLYHYIVFISLWSIIGLVSIAAALRQRCRKRKLFNYDKM